VKIEVFALERWLTTYETRASFDLAESGIYPMTTRDLLALEPPESWSRTMNRLLDLRLGYSEAPGSIALRSMIAETYVNTTPDDVLVTTGAIEANYLLFNVLLEPGDHVVAMAPAYQQLLSVPQAIGCDVSRWEIQAQDGFHFNVDTLEQLVSPRTRLIVLNTPHNPTGAMLTEDDLRRVYGLAESVNAWVLADEAYRWLTMPDCASGPAPMRNLGELGISVGTLSKPFGLPGLRIGWIAGPPDLIAACWAARDYVSLSPGKLNDALAVLALRHRDALIERTRQIVTQNLETARSWFAANEDLVAWCPPCGGLLALMAYALDIPSLELANALAEEASVMLAPGSAFSIEHHLRIGIGQEPEIFAEGLERTTGYLRRLRAEGIADRESWRQVVDASA
jgi:aspartate/methionine/tyrosine aminotransferase